MIDSVWKIVVALPLLALLCMVLVACDDDGDDDLETGDQCAVAADCFEEIDHEQLAGEVTCITKVDGGYCTHECLTDEDCCTVPGECDDGFEYLCAPYTATGESYCFISCEGTVENEHFCRDNAHPDFTCRSTGGGADNKFVCVPEG
jgi:hypothetical protein